MKILSNDELVLSHSKYIYEGDRNTKIEIFSVNDELAEVLERTYDKDGLLILERVNEVGGAELEKTRIEYVEGKPSSKEVFRHTRKIGSEMYEYDSRGNLTKRIRYDRTGSMVEIIEYSYEEVQ